MFSFNYFLNCTVISYIKNFFIIWKLNYIPAKWPWYAGNNSQADHNKIYPVIKRRLKKKAQCLSHFWRYSWAHTTVNGVAEGQVRWCESTTLHCWFLGEKLRWQVTHLWTEVLVSCPCQRQTLQMFSVS